MAITVPSRVMAALEHRAQNNLFEHNYTTELFEGNENLLPQKFPTIPLRCIESLRPPPPPSENIHSILCPRIKYQIPENGVWENPNTGTPHTHKQGAPLLLIPALIPLSLSFPENLYSVIELHWFWQRSFSRNKLEGAPGRRRTITEHELKHTGNINVHKDMVTLLLPEREKKWKNDREKRNKRNP